MNEATGTVIYKPAEGQDLLRDKLANWERFIHEAEDVDPLVRPAVCTTSSRLSIHLSTATAEPVAFSTSSTSSIRGCWT